MTVLIGGLLVWVIFLGLYHPRSGADVLQWRPTRSPELEARVMEDRREQHKLRAAYLADTDDESEESVAADIAQMLARVNEGRRRRGEPEWSLDEYRARLDVDSF